jgi:hypothetical protein
MHVALTGRSGSSDRVSQLLICVCPGDAFLFEQEAGAVVGCVLNEMRVKLLFRRFKVRQLMTCGSGASDG